MANRPPASPARARPADDVEVPSAAARLRHSSELATCVGRARMLYRRITAPGRRQAGAAYGCRRRFVPLRERTRSNATGTQGSAGQQTRRPARPGGPGSNILGTVCSGSWPGLATASSRPVTCVDNDTHGCEAEPAAPQGLLSLSGGNPGRGTTAVSEILVPSRRISAHPSLCELPVRPANLPEPSAASSRQSEWRRLSRSPTARWGDCHCPSSLLPPGPAPWPGRAMSADSPWHRLHARASIRVPHCRGYDPVRPSNRF